MAYLGNAPARSFISFERQVFTIVNSQTAYTLSHSVTNENDIRLVVNNIVQEPGSGKAYTASGTTLTLSAALTNGTDEMYCVFLGRAIQTVNPPNASVGTSQLASTSVTAAKLNNDIISGTTALGATPADTDELLISDAGTLKRVDYSYLKSANTPSFHAYLSSNQSVSATTFTKCNFNTESWDTDNCYDNSSNYRFTPNAAGKYYVYSMIFSDGSTSPGSHFQLITDIRKNGSSVSYATVYVRNYTDGGDGAWNSFTTVDMNGSSDYLEVFGYIRNSGTNNFLGQANYTFFGAYKLIGV